MSSTNRNKTKPRDKYDYYVTPDWVIEELLSEISEYDEDKGLYFKSEFAPTGEELLSELEILDPCAGGSLHHGMSYADLLLKKGATSIDTIDLRADSRASKQGNFLEMEFDQDYDLIMTNPPYLLAQKFVEKSLQVTKPGGFVIMLLRLNFYGSKKRLPFWNETMPLYTFAHSRRVCFTGDNKTDSTEYAHFVWQKDNYPEFTKLKVLGSKDNKHEKKKK